MRRSAADMRGNLAIHYCCRAPSDSAALLRAVLDADGSARAGAPGEGEVESADDASAGSVIEATNNDGHTPLATACWHGRPGAVEVLLARGIGSGGGHNHARVDVNRRMRGGLTPLLAAAYEGHAALVRALLAAGADASARTDSGATTLFAAASRGHVETMRVLLDTASSGTGGTLDIEAVANCGLTALGCAEACAQGESATLLRERGCTKQGELEINPEGERLQELLRARGEL